MVRLIVMPIVAGVIATGGMTAFLLAINRSGWANADMVRAVGSLVTRSSDNALAVGLVIHFLNGMVIAAGYLHVLSVIGAGTFAGALLFGGTLGFGQGFVVAWGIIRFAHRHPAPEFQDADYQVAIAHVIGHVVYGVLLGAAFATMRSMGFDVSPGI